MTTKSGSAEIYDMTDALARRRATVQPAAAASGVGLDLAAAREAAGLTIQEAADKIHIKLRHLEAIEALEIANLPPRPYAIGFVRAYAEFLGLKAPEIVSRFKEDAGYGAPTPIDVDKFEPAETPARDGKRDMSLLAVVAIIGFFIWCAFQITTLDDAKRETDPVRAAAGPASAQARLPRAPTPAPANVIEARVIERVDPIYPLNCIDESKPIETVVIAFNITAAGRVSGERIAQSTNACLDAAALNAVRRWRFEPRKVDGAPRSVYDQKYSFSFARPR